MMSTKKAPRRGDYFWKTLIVETLITNHLFGEEEGILIQFQIPAESNPRGKIPAHKVTQRVASKNTQFLKKNLNNYIYFYFYFYFYFFI
jgi:hypothetical protein